MDELTNILGNGNVLELIYGSSEVLIVFIYVMGLFSFYLTFIKFGQLGQINQGSSDVWTLNAIAWTFIGGVFFIYFGSFVNALHQTVFVASVDSIQGGSPLSWRIDDRASVGGLDTAEVAIKTVVGFIQFLGVLGIYFGVRNLQKIGRTDLGQASKDAGYKAFWNIFGGVLLLDPITTLSGAGFFVPMLGDLASNMSDAIES
jgi:hypothetical protein